MNSPLTIMADHIPGLIIASLRLIGLSFMYDLRAGSPPKARAARVSITKLTHNSWMRVNGKSNPTKGPKNTSNVEAALMVDWKTINFLMDLLRH